MIPSTTSRLRFRQKENLVCSKGSWVENLEMESVNLHTSGYASSVKNLLSGGSNVGSHPQTLLKLSTSKVYVHFSAFVKTLKNSSNHRNHMTCLSVDGSERELDSLTTGKEKGSWALQRLCCWGGYLWFLTMFRVERVVSCFSKSSSHQKWVLYN